VSRRRKKQAFDINNPQHVKERNADLEFEQDSAADELIRLLDTYTGRAYIWRYISYCEVFSSSYRGEDELHKTLFREGKRAVGQMMVNEILTHYPKAFTLMQSEAAKRDKERKGDI